jgi:hypothetical protein
MVDHELVLDRYVAESDRMLRAPDGRRLWIMNPPVAREWTTTRRLAAETPMGWSLTGDARGIVLRCESNGRARSEVDFVDLDPEAAAALLADTSEPMLVLGSFSTLSSAMTIGQFLVGGEVLDTTDFGGHRVISEQTALSLYRIARRRSGPFWDLVSSHLTSYVAGRVDAVGAGRLVHDMWGAGESHARFVADAALLLIAASEHDPGATDVAESARRAVRLLDDFGRPCGGGTWYAHDTSEIDAGRHDLVLNTHLQAILVRLAAGLEVAGAMRAARAALETVPEWSRGRIIGYGLRAASIVGLASNDLGDRCADRLRRSAVGIQHRTSRVMFPGGWIARDASGHAAPDYYLTVNLNDLAAVAANVPVDGGVARPLARGLRFARTGFITQERRRLVPTAALVPNLLRISGDVAGAHHAAARLRRSAMPPAIGWPGFEDHLWARLRAGTP